MSKTVTKPAAEGRREVARRPVKDYKRLEVRRRRTRRLLDEQGEGPIKWHDGVVDAVGAEWRVPPPAISVKTRHGYRNYRIEIPIGTTADGFEVRVMPHADGQASLGFHTPRFGTQMDIKVGPSIVFPDIETALVAAVNWIEGRSRILAPASRE